MPVAGTNSVISHRTIPESGPAARARGRLPSMSLVLPMFNEADCVEQTLGSALHSLSQNFAEFEIIVVDDGSTDDCAARVEIWARRDPRIRLIRLWRNQRFGGALRAGLAASSKELVFYTDFDLPVDLGFFPEVVQALEDSAVVTGYSPEYPKNLSWSSKLLSRGYNALVRAFFGLGLRDVNFGLKAMRRSVVEGARLVSRSPFVDAELFIEAQRGGHQIRELAVPFSPRKLGVSRIRRSDVIAWTLLDMLRIRLFPARRGQGSSAEKASSEEVAASRGFGLR
jgi:glycosyltransferase involved in cell wall biosynthesis